ncbi:MAG: radical SAM protein [Proteobacteria bacterium]|nr:radical SAM protein [Pseudomonadota bacterium]
MTTTRFATNRAPLVLIPQYFGSLIFDRRTSRYMPFDHQSTDLWLRLCHEPMHRVITKADEAAIRDFCDYFYDRGFFTLDGYFAGAVLEVEPPTDHLTGPLAVHLEIIAACNLTCSHCFAGVLPRKGRLGLDEMDRLFTELAAMGSFRLGLTGGEPLLRRDLCDILDAATARGLHPCLTTNGLLIDEHIARELGRRDLVWLNISLDGATARTNDRIRGPGTFHRVLEKLRLLARYARFTLAFTVTSESAGEIEACVQLARDVGAHTAVFRPLYPVGVAASRPELMPSFAQYTASLGRLSACEPGADVHAIDPFSPQSREQVRARTYSSRGCGAANLIASISVDGQVNPCSFSGPALNAGSIRERSFGEIWHHSAGFRAMRALSSSRPGCSDCDSEPGERAEGERFRGGCRARAQAFSGHLDAPDPWYDEWEDGLKGAYPPLTNLYIDS